MKFGRKNSQSAGDGANQYSAEKIQIVQNLVNTEEVRELARREGREVVKNSLPEIAAAAAATLMERGHWFVDLVLDTIDGRNDPRLFGRISDPRIQIALMDAQRDFSETNDEHLGHLLANVVTDMMEEPVRSHDELLLKQCLEVAPKLTGQQLSTLAVIAHLHRVWYGPVSDPITLLGAIHSTFEPYYGSLVTEYQELDYMESIGVCSEIQFSPDMLGEVYNSYSLIIRMNPQASYLPFSPEEVPDSVPPADLQSRARLVSDGASNAGDCDGKYVMRPELREDIIAAQSAMKTDWMKRKSERGVRDELATFVVQRTLKEDAMEAIAREHLPDLARFLEHIDRVGILRFTATITGMKLAEQEAKVRNPDSPTILSRAFERPSEVSGSEPTTPSPEAG